MATRNMTREEWDTLRQLVRDLDSRGDQVNDHGLSNFLWGASSTLLTTMQAIGRPEVQS